MSMGHGFEVYLRSMRFGVIWMCNFELKRLGTILLLVLAVPALLFAEAWSISGMSEIR